MQRCAQYFNDLRFIRLFEEHGDLLLLFNKFRELKTREQQASSEELAEHANKVMETLDEGIRGLDDLNSFFDYLHQVGASHTRIPGFKAEYFWVSNYKIVVEIRAFIIIKNTNIYLENRGPVSVGRGNNVGRSVHGECRGDLQDNH